VDVSRIKGDCVSVEEEFSETAGPQAENKKKENTSIRENIIFMIFLLMQT
jgi:hypothetical protein